MDWSLPSRYSLGRYLEAFVQGFHPSFPALHIPSLQLQKISPELALAICALGAQHCFENENSVSLFYASRSILFEQMRRREEGLIANASCEPRSQPQHPIIIGDRYMTVADPIWPEDPGARSLRMQTACSTMFLLCFASWQKDVTLLRESFVLQGILARCCRENGLVEPNREDRDLAWETWAQEEFERRVKLIAFCVLSLQSIAYNLPPTLLSSEIHLRMPSASAEWNATTTQQWQSQRKNGITESTFQDFLEYMFEQDNGKDEIFAQKTTSALNNSILMHAILQRIQILWQLVIPSRQTTGLNPSDMEVTK